jgi:hypothetical protein
MRALQLSMVVALSAGFPTTLVAQTEPASTTTATSNQPQTTPGSTGTASELPSRWIASGFVGSNFANNANPSSTEFGGAIGYLWRSKYGAEFDTGVTPNFQLQNNFFGLGITPMITTYMANAVGAMPLGPDAKWQPFISGGVGAIALRSTFASNQLDYNATRFGGDLGAGVLGFVEHVGFKADVRYFRTTGKYSNATYVTPNSTGSPSATPVPSPSPTPSPTPGPSPTPTPPGPYLHALDASTSAATADTSAAAALASSTLSGLHFWRANVGVAFRW